MEARFFKFPVCFFKTFTHFRTKTGDLPLKSLFDSRYLHQQLDFHGLYMLEEHLGGDLIRHGRRMVENFDVGSKPCRNLSPEPKTQTFPSVKSSCHIENNSVASPFL